MTTLTIASIANRLEVFGIKALPAPCFTIRIYSYFRSLLLMFVLKPSLCFSLIWVDILYLASIPYRLRISLICISTLRLARLVCNTVATPYQVRN